MCGIVFAGSNTMGTRDVEFFEQLLYCDIVRGDHSTGVFAGYHNYGNEPFEVRIRKAAVPADVFIRTPTLWDEVKQDKKPHATIKNSFTTKFPKFLVGHNRYATMGEIVDRNAHPFQHGAVTLVHNGTLDNQTLLPDHQRFKVDSENVAHAINLEGIDETLKKLHGKFMLIWHDARDNTLNFLRNKDRPFHFVETSTGDWFGASEEDMIMWLIGRPKSPTAKRHFEAEVGVQYVFDVSNGQFKFKEERKHELPTFRYVYQSGYTGNSSAWYNDYDDDYEDRFYRGRSTGPANDSVRSEGSGNQTQSRSQNTQTTQSERLNALLESHGVRMKVGEWIFFDSFQFDEYPNGSNKGKMTGYMNSMEYIEVQAPGFNKADYKEGGEYRGKIISCYEMNYILHVVVGPAEPRNRSIEPTNVIKLSDLVERMAEEGVGDTIEVDLIDVSGKLTTIPKSEDPLPPEEVIPEEDSDQESCAAITANGELVTKKEWDCNGALNCCANCGSPIPWSDAEVTEVRKGNSWCQDCAAEIDESGNLKSSGSERPSFQFKCTVCGYDQHEDLESSIQDVCVMCVDAHRLTTPTNIKPLVVNPPKAGPIREVLKFRNKLQNGMIVTKTQWERMNNCGFCYKKIPWSEAEATEFVGQRACCGECSKELDEGRLPIPPVRRR